MREETRRQVLDAAVAAFANRGIAATSINDIAAAAGLTKGAVYSNFESKDELVLTIMEEHVLERMTATAPVFDETLETEQAIRAAGAQLLTFVHDDATWHRLLIEYWTLAMRDENMRANLADRRRELHAAVARAIEQAARAREVTLPLSPHELAIALIALSNGLAIERGIYPEAVPDDLFPNLLALLTHQP